MEVLIVVLYFIVVLAIGVWASRRQHQESDFIIGGRRFGPMVLGLAIVSTMVSGFAFVGMPGLTYLFGYAPVVGLWAFGGALAFLTGTWVMARPFWIISRKYGVLTVPDLLETVYESRSVRIASTVVIFIVLTTFLVVQWQSIGRVTQIVLKVDFTTAVLIGAGVVALYSILGGMLSAILTDVAQMVLMFLAAIVIFATGYVLTGGFVALNESLVKINPTFVEPWQPTGGFAMGFILSYFVFSGLTTMVGPAFSTKFFAARDLSVFRWIPIIAFIAYGVCALEWFSGPYVRVLVAQGKMAAPAAPDLAAATFISLFFHPVVAGVIFAGVLAAMMSTIDSFLVVISAAIMRDFVGQILGVRLTQEQHIRWLRITTLIVAVVSVVLSLNPITLIGILAIAAFSLISTTLWPVVALGLRWKRANGTAATVAIWASFLTTGGITLINAFTQPPVGIRLLFDASVVGFVVGVACLVVISLLSPARERKIFRDWPKKPAARPLAAAAGGD